MFGDDGLVAKLDPDDTSVGLTVIYNDLLIDSTAVNSLLAGVKAAEGEFSDVDERTLDLILTYVTTEDGDDIMSGETADDMMFGGGGNDLMGGDVDPRLPDAGGPTDISEDMLIGDGGMITFDQRRFRSIATVSSLLLQASSMMSSTTMATTTFSAAGNDFLFGATARWSTSVWGLTGSAHSAARRMTWRATTTSSSAITARSSSPAIRRSIPKTSASRN
jgi:Ca2+-binding RTX toxin-like protein